MFRQTCVMWVASKRTKHMCLNQHWGSMHTPCSTAGILWQSAVLEAGLAVRMWGAYFHIL